MKIVVMPGVGFYSEDSKIKHKKFIDKLSCKLNCECEMHYWEHGWQIPETSLPFRSIRRFVAEVILDFQKIVRDAPSMKVPDADVYIGHSAGSILALLQTKPSVVFGSPAALVEVLHEKNEIDVAMSNTISKIISGSIPTLNIINKNDFIAYPLYWNNVENFVIPASLLNPIDQFPGNAHNSYWEDNRVINKIIKNINKWKTEKIV